MSDEADRLDTLDEDLDCATGGNAFTDWFKPDPNRPYTPNARCQAAPWLPQCRARAEQERQRLERAGNVAAPGTPPAK
jgi:hypothetical protein